jgi:hypothetical protein
MANDQAQGLPAPPTPTLPPSKGEALQTGVGGFLKAITGQQMQGSDLEASIQKHYQQRVEEARMNAESASRAWAILHDPNGIDPETGKPLDDAGRQKYQNRFDTAYAAYNKAAGVSKESKGIIAQGRSVLDHFSKRVQQQRAQQGGGQGGGMPPPPQARAAAPPEPGSGMLPGGIPAPPQSSMGSNSAIQPIPNAKPGEGKLEPIPNARPGEGSWTPADEATRGPFERQFLADQHALQQKVAEEKARGDIDVDVYKRENDILRNSKMATPAELDERKELAKKIGLEPGSYAYQFYLATGTMSPSVTAMGKPQSIKYKSGSKELFGWKVGTELYDQDMNPLPSGTEAFVPGAIPKVTTGTTEHIDPVTGEREIIHSSHTTAPASGSSASPKKSGDSKPVAQSEQDTRREDAYKKRQDLRNVTGTTRTMIETAPRVESLVARTRELVKQQQATLGPAASRWSEFMAGKIGAPNEQFTALRTDVGLLQTLLMRMHVGARGGNQIMEHFRDLIDSSKQSPENLLAALDEIQRYAESVAAEMPDSGPPSTNKPLSQNPPPAKTPTTADEYLQSIGVK